MNTNDVKRDKQGAKADGNDRSRVMDSLRAVFPAVRFWVTEGNVSRFSSTRYDVERWTKTKVTWTDGPPVHDVATLLECGFERPPGGYRLKRRLTDEFAAAHAFRAAYRGERARFSINDPTELTDRERLAGTLLVALCGEQDGGQRELVYARFLREYGVEVIDRVLNEAPAPTVNPPCLPSI